MRITPDTSVLVRSVVRDDERQALAAARVLKEADVIAITIPTLCEFVWVLRKVYGFEQPDVASAVRALINTGNLVMNRPAVEAGSMRAESWPTV